MGGELLAPAAAACNITLSSPDLQDVSGCYTGRASHNSKAKWVKLDESTSIEWQVRYSKQGPDWFVLEVDTDHSYSMLSATFSFSDALNSNIPPGATNGHLPGPAKALLAVFCPDGRNARV